MSNATGERNLEIIQEVLEIFPEKTQKAHDGDRPGDGKRREMHHL